ncbi:dTDP-glucose 4,6-dehydratase [Candidatus Peregrinibacteria bacterium]|nr:dTDP-glucose 4,6-dehydratase [Candidatus Peregrinibacteria bacterium]
MNLLITGGAGFIGSNFILHIARKYPDYTIINLDKLTYAANHENLKLIEKKKNYFFIHGDICDKKLIQKICQTSSIDIIVHFAAESHVDRSIQSPETFIKTNIIGTHVLLQVALKAKIRRFIQISTDEVYGSLGKKGHFTEKSTLKPSSPYSASKASADLLALSYFYTYGFPVIITRSTNNYGPRQYIEKFIPVCIKNLLKNKKVPIYGHGENIRDWIYVEDNCEAIDKVMHSGIIGEIYNIGANCEKNNKEVANLLIQKLEKPENFIQYIQDRPGHDFRYSLSTQKIHSELHWKAKTSFNEGIQKTIEWYKNHF